MSYDAHTVRQIMSALYRENIAGDGGREEALVAIVLDLLMEVEALRETIIRMEKDRGSAHYRASYRDAAYLTHDASGPLGGLGKLLGRYYTSGEAPRARDEDVPWREALMMRRLGMTEEEIARWKEEAGEAETFT